MNLESYIGLYVGVKVKDHVICANKPAPQTAYGFLYSVEDDHIKLKIWHDDDGIDHEYICLLKDAIIDIIPIRQ